MATIMSHSCPFRPKEGSEKFVIRPEATQVVVQGQCTPAQCQRYQEERSVITSAISSKIIISATMSQ